MDKLATLKETLGEERFNEVLAGLTEKEKTALGLGLTPKEDQTTEASTTEAAPTAVDVTKLTEAVATVLKPISDGLEALKTQVEATSKETEGLEKIASVLTDIQSKLVDIETTAKNAEKGVTELKGDVSRSTAKTLRASESTDTITQKEVEGAKQDPQKGGLETFLSEFVLGHVAKE